MTLPTDFDSFASGWNFTSSGYSAGGSGSGTWTNLVSGQGVATQGSLAPTFATKAGLSGAVFAGSANEEITIDWPFGQECTIVVTCTAQTFAATRYLMGTTANNDWAMWVHTGGEGRVLVDRFGLGVYSTNSATADTPYIYTATFSPMEQKIYSQVNDTTANTATLSNRNSYYPEYPTVTIGQTNTGRHLGWVARVLIFNRALHYRDNTNLQALIATEMDNIGL